MSGRLSPFVHAMRDVYDAAATLLVFLVLAPFLWLCCVEERRLERRSR